MENAYKEIKLGQKRWKNAYMGEIQDKNNAKNGQISS